MGIKLVISYARLMRNIISISFSETDYFSENLNIIEKSNFNGMVLQVFKMNIDVVEWHRGIAGKMLDRTHLNLHNYN